MYSNAHDFVGTKIRSGMGNASSQYELNPLVPHANHVEIASSPNGFIPPSPPTKTIGVKEVYEVLEVIFKNFRRPLRLKSLKDATRNNRRIDDEDHSYVLVSKKHCLDENKMNPSLLVHFSDAGEYQFIIHNGGLDEPVVPSPQQPVVPSLQQPVVPSPQQPVVSPLSASTSGMNPLLQPG